MLGLALLPVVVEMVLKMRLLLEREQLELRVLVLEVLRLLYLHGFEQILVLVTLRCEVAFRFLWRPAEG